MHQESTLVETLSDEVRQFAYIGELAISAGELNAAMDRLEQFLDATGDEGHRSEPSG